MDSEQAMLRVRKEVVICGKLRYKSHNGTEIIIFSGESAELTFFTTPLNIFASL